MASNSTSRFRSQHVHLVGSIHLPTTTETFCHLSTTFPTQLLRLPDGEPGKRATFVGWQRAIFAGSNIRVKDYWGKNLTEVQATPSDSSETLNPGYDTYAVASYAEFCRLRQEGVISKGVRFQVCLPTPVNVIACNIHPEDQVRAEPLYEAALLSSLRRIQDQIPARDLAIQWDVALEFALLEFSAFSTQPDWKPAFVSEPWFSPLKDGIVERIVRLAGNVDEGVEMGFHLCYGDSGHKHFIEPASTSLLVEISNLFLSSIPIERQINWIHMPVPKSRTDKVYFAPLKNLKLRDETELFLGLAHPFDEAGTRERIKVAGGFVKEFGVATECGMGRMRAEGEFESAMAVLKAVTDTD